jgi:hypothetical protein
MVDPEQMFCSSAADIVHCRQNRATVLENTLGLKVNRFKPETDQLTRGQ